MRDEIGSGARRIETEMGRDEEGLSPQVRAGRGGPAQ
jgi:hypothetical protein